MSQKKLNMRLCGGTFLKVLFNAKKRNMSQKDIFWNIIEATSEKALYREIPECTLKVSLSKYVMCKNRDSSFIFMTDIEKVRREFNDEVTGKYTQTLRRFRKVFEEAINDDSQKKWIIAALLDMILRDDSISESTEFYMSEDGTSVKKMDLRNQNEYCFSAFLMGVWHYVFVSMKDNTVGKDTVENLLAPHKEGEGANHAPREFSSEIGKKRAKMIVLRGSPDSGEIMEEHGTAEAPKEEMQLRILYKSSSITDEETQEYISGTSKVRMLPPDGEVGTSDIRSGHPRTFKLRTVYEFDWARMDNENLAVEIKFEYGGSSFCGLVSASNWKSDTVRNTTVNNRSGEFTAWFWDPSPSDQGQVTFLLICGDE